MIRVTLFFFLVVPVPLRSSPRVIPVVGPLMGRPRVVGFTSFFFDDTVSSDLGHGVKFFELFRSCIFEPFR